MDTAGRGGSNRERRTELSLDENDCAISIDEERIPLTRTQFKIFQLIAERGGAWMQTGELVERIWDRNSRADSSAILRVHLHGLRRALGEWSDVVETDPRRTRGYRLRIDAVRVRNLATPAPAPTRSPP